MQILQPHPDLQEVWRGDRCVCAVMWLRRVASAEGLINL